MPPIGYNVPVVLIIFNRYAHTKSVFNAIASVRPEELFVIADGPRHDKPDDAAKCEAARAVLNGIDWNCKLRTNFSDKNLGCGERISSGLDWVFNRVDQAVILEDDCVPHVSFFRFSSDLLERYKDDVRVRTISGSNFLRGKIRSPWSYHFSRFHDIWGWATWKRSWERTDMLMRLWPTVRDEGWLIDMVGSRRRANFWASRFNNTYEGRTNSWVYPYQLSCWLDHSLAVTPNRNLVSNVGFGADATNTPYKADFLGQSAEPISFPLAHPPFMIPDSVSDDETFRRRFLPERSAWARRAARRVYYFLSGKDSTFSVRVGLGRLSDRSAR
jgi:hypothetical protein